MRSAQRFSGRVNRWDVDLQTNSLGHDVMFTDAVSGPDFCYSPNTNGDVRGNCNEFADGTFQECEPE